MPVVRLNRRVLYVVGATLVVVVVAGLVALRAQGSRLAPERLSFSYEILGGQGLAWRPVRVFDDGQHVYIQMPATLQASEAPVLLVQSRGDDSALVNYRVRLPYYVVDRLFDTAVLIVGVGHRQDRVTIRRKADPQ